jgi:hypothetical protein
MEIKENEVYMCVLTDRRVLVLSVIEKENIIFGEKIEWTDVYGEYYNEVTGMYETRNFSENGLKILEV